MQDNKFTKLKLNGYTEEDEKITIKIEGDSSMPFWNHDLKFEAVIALLSTVDEKDFAEDNRHDDYYRYAKKVIESLNLPNFENVSDQYFNWL